MSTKISFEYPLWFIAFCILAGAAYSFALYYREQIFNAQPSRVRHTMAALRFFTVSILSFLLLSPVLQTLITEIKKPIVILAQDVSESIGANFGKTDSAAYHKNFMELKQQLEKQYDVQTYSFGAEVREGANFAYRDKFSDISEVFSTIYDLYGNQNLGAVILATDGIYNRGSNPMYAGSQLSVPIFTVALGDTTPRRDLVVKRVFYNKIAYLGDQFTIQTDVTAFNAAGNTSKMTIYKVKGKQLIKINETPLNIGSNDFFFTQEYTLNADESGVQRYKIVLTAINGEVSTENNAQDIFIDVLDARQKILILANAPHPDLTTLKQLIDNNKNYQSQIAFGDGDLAAADLVVLHQLPSKTNPAADILKALNDSKKPRFFIVGNQSNLPLVNQSQTLATVQNSRNNTNEVQATIEKGFNLFTLDDRLYAETPKFPPLIAPFGEYQADEKASVLLYQKIGAVGTKYPLLAFGETQNAKTAVLFGEGIWKWRLFDYMQRKNYDLFDELFGKTIQYLTVKEDKRKFRVNVNKNIFNENEKVFFDAELYNNSYELINEPEVSLTVTDENNKNFTYTFNKTSNAYTLDAGILPVGNYTFVGKVNVNGEQLSHEGRFSIQPVQVELVETTANHALLRLVSEKYDGTMVFADQIGTLASLLENKNSVKPKFYDTLKTQSLINLKWIFFLLLGLLTIEWFMRRYFGGY